ncbi:hypothetical protein KBD20_00705 [Candidatus Saccharibacteria bacterium]|nr:hypothetical protein [Candidatus Saccharibacteria bacterium]
MIRSVLSEAITSINDGDNTSYDECVNSGDAFGITDTINLPNGEINLTADVVQSNVSMVIQGEGMDESVINGGGAWRGLHMDGTTGSEEFRIQGVTVVAFSSVAVGVSSGNVSLDQIEADGTGSVAFDGIQIGVIVQNRGAVPSTYNLTNIYVHSIGSVGANVAQGIAVMTGGDATNTAYLDKITIEDISSDSSVAGINIGTGVFDPAQGDMNATIRNITVSNISSTVAPASAIGVATFGSTQQTNLVLQHATVLDISGVDIGLGFASASIGAITVAPSPGDNPQSSVTVSNSILAASCVTTDISALVIGPGTGVGTQSISSLGGNLSDNSSCASFLNNATDQNNVAGLTSSIQAFADNGGYIPTRALAQGSLAIDSGITISNLTTDARQAVRPQGGAYDSGAYESPYTKPVATLASTGQSAVAVAVVGLLVISATSIFAIRRHI